MPGRLSRFLNLERARAPSGQEPSAPLSRERFRPAGAPPPPPHEPAAPPSFPAAAGESGPDAPAPVVDEQLERLRLERQRQLASGVLLDDRADSEQPFLRCALCEMDNNRFVPRCQNCGADLATEEQRGFNARFWAQRSAEAAREREEFARLAATRSEEAAADPASMRAWGEAIARQVAEREERRLGTDEPPRLPAGMRALNLIPSPGWRLAAALGTMALALLLGYYAVDELRRGVRFGFAEVLFLAIVVMFIPPRRRRRGIFGWFDGNGY